MITIRDEIASDVAAREALLDAAMGATRRLKPSERLREGNQPAEGLALVACEGASQTVAGSVRLWPVLAGTAGEGTLLGPLAVSPEAQGQGVGSLLMQEALARAEAAGWRFVLLVGDAAYYRRFGFGPAPAGLAMPGEVDPARFLALEFEAGALAQAEGKVTRPLLSRRRALRRARQLAA